MKQIILIVIGIIFTSVAALHAAAEEYKPGETFNSGMDKPRGNYPEMVVLPLRGERPAGQ